MTSVSTNAHHTTVEPGLHDYVYFNNRLYEIQGFNEDYGTYLGGGLWVDISDFYWNERMGAWHESYVDSRLTDTRPDWDAYWLGVAESVSKRADCTRRQVGAVIVDSSQRIVSSGYNGGPPKGPSCLKGECPRGQSTVEPGSSYDTGPGSCVALHAEQNAFLWGDVSRMAGGIIYITDAPCDGCRKMIQGMPIQQAIWPNGSWSRDVS